MRDIKQLHPQLQLKIAELQLLCKKKGLNIGIGECLRTVAEQDALYAQGRTKPGLKVTNAKGSTYSSQHQWGIAFDFYRNDGKGAYNEAGDFFGRVGALAKQIGLGWGGDWKSPVDKPHIYLKEWGGTTSVLRSAYGTPDKFMRTWDKTILNYKIGGTYRTTKPCYLRLSPAGKKLDYKNAPDHIKEKSTKKGGKVSFKKGAAFTLMEIANKSGNIWGRMKTGYWVPLHYNSALRAIICK